ncbi:hypothetical protein CBL_00410 [Carabus blaptoides fortunei]
MDEAWFYTNAPARSLTKLPLTECDIKMCPAGLEPSACIVTTRWDANRARLVRMRYDPGQALTKLAPWSDLYSAIARVLLLLHTRNSLQLYDLYTSITESATSQRKHSIGGACVGVKVGRYFIDN